MRYTGSNGGILIRALTMSMLLLLPFINTASSQNISVSVNGPRINKFDNLRSFSNRGEFIGDYYVAADQFADILEIDTDKEEVLKKLRLYIEGRQVTLTSGNPFVKIDDGIYQMPLEVKMYRGEFYFPLRELMAIFNTHLPGAYKFNQNARRLEIYFGDVINITGLTVENKTNGSLVKIQTTKYFGENLTWWKNDNNLYVNFYTGKLDTLQLTDDETRGLVLRNTAIQHSQIAQITFKLSAYAESIDITENESGGEVLISLTRKSSNNPQLLLLPRTRDDFDISEMVAREKESWEINTIVIDPGHGGKDPGTNSPDGLNEKDIALDIARNLGNLLRNSEIVEKVIFTRNSDIFIPLQKRSEIANTSGGKLFISIHVNSNKNRSLRGFETYILSPGKNQDALEVLEVVQRENNVVHLYEDKDPNRVLTEEDKMVLSLTQSAFVKESERLAHYISEGIGRKVNWPDRGVKQAGFLVLWEVTMPSVLVEAGFLSNAGQRNDLRRSSVKHRIAEGIFEGIKKFIEEARR